MKIIAVDPGYDRLGIAVLEKKKDKENLIYSECFETKKSLGFHQRLLAVGKQIKHIIKEYRPKYLAIEKLYFNKNHKTAMGVAEIKGTVIYQCLENGLEVKEFSPQEIKMAVTGYGRSSKEQVVVMVKNLIDVKKDKALDDEFDAIAVGLTFFATSRIDTFI